MNNLILLLISIQLLASDYFYPFVDNPTKDIFQSRRDKLNSKLYGYQSFIAFSSDYYTTTENHTFRQSSNLLYLTGIPSSKAILLLDPEGIDLKGTIYNEILFLDYQADSDKIWHGIALTPEFAKDSLGFELVLDIDDFSIVINNHLRDRQELLITPFTNGKHFSPYLNSKVESLELKQDIVDELTNTNPYLLVETESKHLKNMRAIKDSSEISLIQKAIDITSQSHIKSIQNIHPNIYEYEIEAVMEGTFLELGSENTGYNSIIGAGANTCYLHYTSNRQQAKDGDLILMDCGAQYHGYTADITRTVPANGKFTEEQKIIYNIVLNAQEKAISNLKEGLAFAEIDSIARNYIDAELIDLDILASARNSRKYFPHGTSHYLGLDVHDVGPYDTLSAGNIITIEPGVYIRENSDCDPKWWNIGVRIEDDVLITRDSCVVLSEKLQKQILEIEKLMEK